MIFNFTMLNLGSNKELGEITIVHKKESKKKKAM